MTADGQMQTVADAELSWLLYFLGPTKSGVFEHSIRQRWNITTSLFKQFKQYGFNDGFDDDIAEDDALHQQFIQYKRKAVEHNYHAYFSGSFIESFDVKTPSDEKERRFYSCKRSRFNMEQNLADLLKERVNSTNTERHTEADANHVSSDLDLLILDWNRSVDTSPDRSRMKCRYQANEEGGSHKGYVQIVEKESRQPLEHPSDHKEILLGALLFALNTLGEELVSVPDLERDMIEHGPAITLKCQTRAVADTDRTVTSRIIDLVYALPCSDWPIQAQSVETRPMRRLLGTSSERIFRHKNTGYQSYCCLVPVAHRSSLSPKTEWRYSFSMLEALMSERLQKRNECILIIYRILKYLWKYRPASQQRVRDFSDEMTEEHTDSFVS